MPKPPVSPLPPLPPNSRGYYLLHKGWKREHNPEGKNKVWRHSALSPQFVTMKEAVQIQETHDETIF